MKSVRFMTSYDIYMYMFIESELNDWDVEYIQFDDVMNYHHIGEKENYTKLYDEWCERGRKNEIFVALIKWFDIRYKERKIVFCLMGTDGRLHYENQ